MPFKKIIIFILFAVLFSASSAFAHFGMLIPSESAVMESKNSQISFDIAFSHPSIGIGMDMEKPEAFSVNVDGKSLSLIDTLSPSKFMDKKSWTATYNIKRPGVYQFCVTPAPYFEPAEDCFIIHYTKTIIPAFGSEDGWEKPLGLPMEIVPVTRPFGNFSGSVFQGLVLKNGKPLPWATVEIESLNRNPRHAGPNEYYETQIARTDSQGIFTVGIPWSGWWGFAALSTSDDQLEMNGQKKDIEMGGILWINFTSPTILK